MRLTGIILTLIGASLMACQDAQVQDKATQSQLSSDDLSPTAPAAGAADEQVVPPTQISGAWLGAVVLNENATARGEQSQIGLANFYRGLRVSDNPSRFVLTVSTSMSGDPNIRIDLQSSSKVGYDRILTVAGPNQKSIRQAYASTQVFVTIVDLQDNSSDSISMSLEQALAGTKTMLSNSVHASSISVSTSSSSSGTTGP